MRKPLFWRNVNLAIGAGGLASTAAARLPGVGDGALLVVLTLAGSTGLLIGICGTIICWAYARTEAALRRGEGVMGRWRIDPAAWPGFLSLEKWMAAAKDPWPNAFTLPKGAEAKSLEVIVGEEGVLIGDDVFRLPRRSPPQITGARLRAEPGTPVCVELWLYLPPTPNRFGTSAARGLVLRFPSSSTAEAEAARYVTWCQQGRPGEGDPVHGRGDGKGWARRLGVVLFVLGLVLAGLLGFLIWILGPQLLNPGRSFDGQRFTGTVLQGLGVFALLGSVFALGAAATVYGIWQMVTGRRNVRVAFGMVGVISAVVALAATLKFMP